MQLWFRKVESIEKSGRTANEIATIKSWLEISNLNFSPKFDILISYAIAIQQRRLSLFWVTSHPPA